MSELKEHLFCECDECIREYRGPLSNEMRPYYLKSEADKVIAHHKYKLCLTMAAYFELREDEFGGDFAKRWLKKWLELAEKFKPNSTTQ